MPCLIGLGRWQLRRADEKTVLLNTFRAQSTAPALELPLPTLDAPTLEWRHVKGRGHFLAPNVLLDNRVRDGVAGYEIFTPFEFNNGEQLLVARGYIPVGVDREHWPTIDNPSAEQILWGYLGQPPWVGITLQDHANSEKLNHDLWRVQTLDIQALNTDRNLHLARLVLYLDPAAPGGYERSWPVPTIDVGKHMAYAIQWFAMATVLVLLYLKVSFKTIPHV
ncbi:MAG: SURF1 family protein [Gammaproteobacteria bacterium]|nr:SURF1 family protein [Gammaproteobacteria bacterium]